MFIDEVDKEEKSITVLAEGIYEGEYIKVQYLPHLRLGIVLERGKDDWDSAGPPQEDKDMSDAEACVKSIW